MDLFYFKNFVIKIHGHLWLHRFFISSHSWCASASYNESERQYWMECACFVPAPTLAKLLESNESYFSTFEGSLGSVNPQNGLRVQFQEMPFTVRILFFLGENIFITVVCSDFRKCNILQKEWCLSKSTSLLLSASTFHSRSWWRSLHL